MYETHIKALEYLRGASNAPVEAVDAAIALMRAAEPRDEAAEREHCEDVALRSSFECGGLPGYCARPANVLHGPSRTGWSSVIEDERAAALAAGYAAGRESVIGKPARDDETGVRNESLAEMRERFIADGYAAAMAETEPLGREARDAEYKRGYAAGSTELERDHHEVCERELLAEIAAHNEARAALRTATENEAKLNARIDVLHTNLQFAVRNAEEAESELRAANKRIAELETLTRRMVPVAVAEKLETKLEALREAAEHIARIANQGGQPWREFLAAIEASKK